MTKVYLLLSALFICISNYAQSPLSGINYSTIKSGSWSDPATWSGGVVPTAADAITISNGHTLTIDVNATITDVSWSVGSVSSNILINPAKTFVVTGWITFSPSGTVNVNRTINVGSGHLIAGSILMLASPTGNQDEVIQIGNGGILSISNDLIMRSNSGRHHIDVATGASATITIGGNINYESGLPTTGGGFFNTASSVLNLSGTSNQSIYFADNPSFEDINISGGSAKTFNLATGLTAVDLFSVDNTSSIGLSSATATVINAGGLNYQASATGSNISYLTININGSSGMNLTTDAVIPNISVAPAASVQLNTDFSVPAGRTLTIDGSMDAGSYQVSNEGTVAINGTFVTAHMQGLDAVFPGNDPSIGAASTIEYNAVSAGQKITPNTYANLVTNGAASKTLDGPSIITGDLSIGTGSHVLLGMHNISVSGNISAGPGGFIITDGAGALTKTGLSGTALFPVGTSVSSYSPVSISNPVSTDWSVQVRPDIYPAAINSEFAIQRTWNITPSTATPGATDVVFTYDENDASLLPATWTNPATVMVNHFNASGSGSAYGWTPMGAHAATGTPGAVRTVTITGQESFSPFAISEVMKPLPVKFLSFTGKRSGNINMLTWVTASEENNRGFEVERSSDGVRYTTIGFVKTNAKSGHSDLPLTYTFDDHVSTKNMYYRLRQIDFDGRSNYSNIVLLKNSMIENLSINRLFPNPSVSSMQLWLESPAAQKIMLRIIDQQGRTIQVKEHPVSDGLNTLNIQSGQLPAGTYILDVVSDKGSVRTTFVKM